MSTRALTLALRLLSAACAGAALGSMTGCPLLFNCPEPWSAIEAVDLSTSADIYALASGSAYDEFVAVGAGGIIVAHNRSTGANQSSNPVNVSLRGVTSFDNTVVVVGDAGTILSSSDLSSSGEGGTWTVRESPITDDLLAVARLRVDGELTLVAVAAEQVLVSTDAGQTWTLLPAPAEGWGGLRAAFATQDELWIVGDGGSAWWTRGGAGPWVRQDLGPAAASATLLGGGRVSGDDDSSYDDAAVIVSAGAIWFREATADTWTQLSVSLDEAILAFGAGFFVTAGGAIYDIDGAGSVLPVATVDFAPRAVAGNWGGLTVAGEAGKAARANYQPCVGGRPWIINGQLTTASLVGEIPREDASLGAKLSRAWAADALLEHASVASFARFARELMSLGAPPELILAACRAARDEIVHAELCFEVAARHAGRPLAAGPLPVLANGVNFGSVSDSRAGDPVAIALAVFQEGCINETIAAAQAAVAASQCTDPNTRAVLERIAADETRHAALAWQALRWLVQSDPAVASALAPALREHIQLLRPRPSEPGANAPVIEDDSALRRHGRIPASERAAIHQQVVAELIAPLAGRLTTATCGLVPA